MSTTRANHYVPQWYQKGFLFNPTDKLCYLDLAPDKISLPNGDFKALNSLKFWNTSQCFYQTDLYATFFGSFINDEIERKLFGEIDDMGSKAVRAFISEDQSEWHNHFSDFFTYIDTQKIRTPISIPPGVRPGLLVYQGRDLGAATATRSIIALHSSFTAYVRVWT
jgi:hypothetical protein